MNLIIEQLANKDHTCCSAVEMQAYHRCVKFVNIFPFFLPWLHYVDFLICEWTVCFDIVDDGFGRVAERAVDSCKQSDSTIEKTG